MNIAELLAELRRQDVQLWIESDRLKFSAPVGALSAETKAALANRKEEILAFLRQAERINSLPPAIVPLKADGCRPPLFAFPGHNGDVFCWVHLARHLDPDQALFGVQPPGVDGSEPARSIEELGRHAVEQIRRTRAQGPYLLAGYCAGGTIAFEVARQLTEQKQEIALLALVGTPFPTSLRLVPSIVRWIRGVAWRARRHLRVLTSTSAADGFRYLVGRVRQARQTQLASRDRRLATSESTRRLEVATQAGIRRYPLRRYRGEIDLFLSSESSRKNGFREDRWKTLADGIREHVGPDGCDDAVMLQEPWVPTIASLLSVRLDDVARRSGDHARRGNT